jgi:hypothetical protein
MKQFTQKNSSTILLIVTIWACSIAWVLSLPEPQPAQTELEIQLIEVTDAGYYFLEPTAEFEPRILVPMADVEKWELKDIQVGASVIGLFDAQGWTLEGVKR